MTLSLPDLQQRQYFSYHNKNLQIDVSILHQLEGLHRFRDSLKKILNSKNNFYLLLFQ